MTAIANSGNLYQLSILDKITDSEGNVLEENEPKLTNKIELKQSTWDMVHTGMYKVCNESSYRSQMGGLKVTLAGKSGTAQVSEKLPNHGLFIGYAPYENPEVAATLIIPKTFWTLPPDMRRTGKLVLGVTTPSSSQMRFASASGSLRLRKIP